MQTDRTKTRIASIATVALLALTIVPVLAASASAGSVGPSVAPAVSGSGAWAYGGQAWNSGGFTVGQTTLKWNSTAGVWVIYNATNTSANTTELTANRTVVVDITASYSSPSSSWAYAFKLGETDRAYANVTNAASVTLTNGSTVPALGILNASLHANASLQASLTGTVGNRSASDYLNASGWAHAAVAFTPALGLVPLNLTGVTGWSSSASASGSAAWNLTWSFVNHGWNGTTADHSGSINGTWSETTEVTLFGHIAGTYAGWVDHRLRTAVGLSLNGPFDLYGGVLFVPHAFDLFGGGARSYATAGLGSTADTTQYVYFGAGRVSAHSMSAANLSLGASVPVTSVAGASGPSPAIASPSASSSDPTATVWAQPESPSAAQNQAACALYGCPGSASPLRGLLVVAVVGVAAVVAVALILGTRSRGRGSKPNDTPLGTPLAAAPAMAPLPPTPPTGSDPMNGPAVPPP